MKLDEHIKRYDDRAKSIRRAVVDKEESQEVVGLLRELKAYRIKFEFIISQLEERARQLEDILEKNSWCDGDEEYRLDEINSVVDFIKKTYESKSVIDMEVNADDGDSN